jgi:hypothetical protein
LLDIKQIGKAKQSIRVNLLVRERVMENTKLNLWDRIMMAITFAEAGEDRTAREIMDKRIGREQRPESKVRKEGKRPRMRV